MITYKTSNVLDAKVSALINMVNTLGVMGKGGWLTEIYGAVDACQKQRLKKPSFNATANNGLGTALESWFSSQQIEEQKDGSVILKMRVGALDAVMHWVLR